MMTSLGLNKSDVKDWYLSSFSVFESSQNGSTNHPFHKLRQAAISRFAEMRFPAPRSEEWKYTNLTPLLQHRFRLSADPVEVSSTDLRPFLFEGGDDNRIVLINGRFSTELSQIQPIQGMIIDSLRNALESHSDLTARFLARYAIIDRDPFIALNTAFTTDGAFLYVPANTRLPFPIHVLNISDACHAAFVSHPRNLIVVEEGSEIQFIESYHYVSDAPYFNNVVTEFILGRDARAHYVKIQEESLQAFHIANMQIHQEQDSFFSSVNIDLGSRLARNNLNVRLNAENCETHLFGFYLASSKQLVDNHTFIDHAKPRCFSNELYKGILGGRARGVFNGKILVRPQAQKTNALQSNKTLLLSSEAQINAKPQLEIFADDVKCTHGATVGQLDRDALFYLRARGISKRTAKAILRYAFASDIFESINIDAVQNKLNREMFERLKNVERN